MRTSQWDFPQPGDSNFSWNSGTTKQMQRGSLCSFLQAGWSESSVAGDAWWRFWTKQVCLSVSDPQSVCNMTICFPGTTAYICDVSCISMKMSRCVDLLFTYHTQTITIWPAFLSQCVFYVLSNFRCFEHFISAASHIIVLDMWQSTILQDSNVTSFSLRFTVISDWAILDLVHLMASFDCFTMRSLFSISLCWKPKL